jgi:hypothetical protein
MQVTNPGCGVHVREVKGVERLKKFPRKWYFLTNLDIATGIGRSRKLDVSEESDPRSFGENGLNPLPLVETLSDLCYCANNQRIYPMARLRTILLAAAAVIVALTVAGGLIGVVDTATASCTARC